MDYHGNKGAFNARTYEEDIISTDRRGGIRDDSPNLFFLDANQLNRYYSISSKRGIKAAKNYALSCLNRRKIENPNINEKSLVETARPDDLSSILHRLLDVIIEDDRFGFLTEEDIDRAISVIKTLSNTRVTYQQAASELGCSVPTLHTKVCRERIKTEHVVYLRRNDIDRLKRRKVK